MNKYLNHPGFYSFVLAAMSAPLWGDTTVSSKTVVSGEQYQVADTNKITAGGAVVVQSGGKALFTTGGRVLLQPGFTAQAGSFFYAAVSISSSIPLAWTYAGSAIRYDIYRNGVKIGESTGTTYTDTTAQPGMTYSYTIKAIASGGGETVVITYSSTSAQSFEVFTPLP